MYLVNIFIGETLVNRILGEIGGFVKMYLCIFILVCLMIINVVELL
jgi:hypothetical protein